MTRAMRSSRQAVVLRKRLTEGSPTLVRERLDTFAVAFLNDSRPGLIFEDGRLAFVNEAARRLLSSAASDAFVEKLKGAVHSGVIEEKLVLRSRSASFAPVLQPARSQGHLTRICFLCKRSETNAAYESLSARELDVLRLLVKGLTNGKIGEELDISTETVRKHVARAFEKTGTKTRAGLVGRGLAH